jgi:hypothetical protein
LPKGIDRNVAEDASQEKGIDLDVTNIPHSDLMHRIVLPYLNITGTAPMVLKMALIVIVNSRKTLIPESAKPAVYWVL